MTTMRTEKEQQAFDLGHKAGYSKGYSRAYSMRSSQWPAHKPPSPPQERIAAMLESARALRDEAATQIATFEECDPMSQAIAAKIDAFDAEMRRWTEWLRSGDAPAEDHR